MTHQVEHRWAKIVDIILPVPFRVGTISPVVPCPAALKSNSKLELDFFISTVKGIRRGLG